MERRDGEEGLLLVQGPGVFKEYWNDAEATASSFYGGYFITGAGQQQCDMRPAELASI